MTLGRVVLGNFVLMGCFLFMELQTETYFVHPNSDLSFNGGWNQAFSRSAVSAKLCFAFNKSNACLLSWEKNN